MQQELRRLPSVDRLLSHEGLRDLSAAYSRDAVLGLARDVLDETRQAIAQGWSCPPIDDIVEMIRDRAERQWRAGPRPVINATGVILHTNLGRAPLSRSAAGAMSRASQSYLDLEMDMATGERGSRQVHVEGLLRQVTGAEAGLVVNNNAAAVLLALAALAKGREVIVSRGQAVEIGGGFRIPDVMRQSGAKLKEVGTTNRTYIADYDEAVTERTAALLRVHSSNFRVVGFTHVVPLEEMAELARRRGLMLLDDLGSGCLLDTTQFGLDAEPTVQHSIAAGADMTMFSGDKLLGGPQAGIAVGRKLLIDKMKRHPLARAVRIDKASLAGLTATLMHYVKGEALTQVPVWHMVSMPLSEIEARAQRWAGTLGEVASAIEGESTVGGGSLPGATLSTRLLAIKGTTDLPVTELARRLRHQEPPVVARVERNRLLIDPRTVLPDEDDALLQALKRALAGEH